MFIALVQCWTAKIKQSAIGITRIIDVDKKQRFDIVISMLYVLVVIIVAFYLIGNGAVESMDICLLQNKDASSLWQFSGSNMEMKIKLGKLLWNYFNCGHPELMITEYFIISINIDLKLKYSNMTFNV